MANRVGYSQCRVTISVSSGRVWGHQGQGAGGGRAGTSSWDRTAPQPVPSIWQEPLKRELTPGWAMSRKDPVPQSPEGMYLPAAPEQGTEELDPELSPSISQ